MTAYLLASAYVDGQVREDVRVEVEEGRFTSVTPGGSGEATRVDGLVVPGMANCHSHAFHRALRGRTQRERGSFWTWREQMYDVAGRLDPDLYHRLARATYAEMLAAGITGVGEFHYLHHAPDGSPYDDPNAMGAALTSAARDAGIRITLLDACYLSSGFGQPPEGVQRRFSDGTAEAWAGRVERLEESDGVRIGTAVHSVRAVPREALAEVVTARPEAPLHAHLSEQRQENEQCLAAYGVTPTQLLEEALGPRTSLVHATHLTDADIALIGGSASYSCFCPTTERDLGDGIGPSRALVASGSTLTLGSDSHAVIDLFEEMRATELDERLARETRGHWSAAELLEAATAVGHASLGFADAGAIAVGRRADLVVLDPRSPSLAGTGRSTESVVFAAQAADVRRVMVDGSWVYEGDRGQVGADLADAVEACWT